MSDWDFEKDGPIKLKGNWKWWPNQIIEPEAILANEAALFKNALSVKVPSDWSDLKVIGSKADYNRGFASLAIKLKLGKKSRLFDYYVFGIASAYDAYIFDGNKAKKFLSNGLVSKNHNEAVSQYYPSAKSLKIERDEVFIFLQISNYDFRQIGIIAAPELGPLKERVLSLPVNYLISAILMGTFLFMSLYHILLFLQRKRHLESLWFGLGMIFLVSRTVSSERLLEPIFSENLSEFPFVFLIKTEYISMVCATFFSQLYLYEMLKNKLIKSFIPFLGGICFLFILGFLFSDSHSIFVGNLLNSFQLLLFCLLLIDAFIFIKMSIQGSRMARMMVIGFLLMALTVINDVLYSNAYINTVELMKYGLFLFIFFQAYLISDKFVKAYEKSEYLGENLKKEIEERTIRLEAEKKRAEESEKDAVLAKLIAESRKKQALEAQLQLETKSEIIKADLAAAANLQRTVNELPDLKTSGLEISSFYKPSENIGGDFVIVRELSDNRLFYCQGDISGKGPKAALASLYIRATVEQKIELLESSSQKLLEFLEGINDTITKSLSSEVFSTFSCGILRPDEKRLIYVNGGHPPAIISNDSRTQNLKPSVSPFGIDWSLEDKKMIVQESELEEGSYLLVFSDSVTELPGKAFSRERIGFNRALKISKEHLKEPGEKSAETLSKALLKKTENKNYDDDCSILLIKLY